MPAAESRERWIAWTIPAAEQGEPNLIALSAEGLHIATLPPGHLEAAVARIRSGRQVSAQMISLRSIRSLAGDEDHDDFLVHYTPGTRPRAIRITLANSKDRDELLEALTECVGGVRSVGRPNVLRSMIGPLVLTAGAVFLTLMMHGDAERIAAGEQLRAGGSAKTRLVQGVMHELEEFLGPVGVLVAGGLLIALSLAFVYFKVTRKPIRVVVPKKA
jgi:hypothetical protein